MRLKKYFGKKLTVLLLLTVVSTGLFLYIFQLKRPLLIAPMIGGLDPCLFNKKELARDMPNFKYTKLCLKDAGSPSQLVEATLARISDNNKSHGNYKLGYTLYIPLLRLFDLKGSNIELNQETVRRVAKSVQEVDRPVILYLFSNHFGVGSPVEDFLAKNPDNLMQSAKGSMQKDSFYDNNIYPWSFVNTDNDITKLREKAFSAVLDEVCKLSWLKVRRVEGVTVLGELHHLFPNFQGGMGFSGDYVISDYSIRSVDGFRKYLANKYKSIEELNQYLGSSYLNFEELSPPSKDIRKDVLKHYWDHIDSYAHGILPITGWVAGNQSKSNVKDWIKIYRNGDFLARVPVAFGRQDVLAAHPGISSADVGWSYDLNYSSIDPGLHKIDVFLERDKEPLMLLASRQIAVMEKSQATPKVLVSRELPESIAPNNSVLFSIDNPDDLSSYYYNPLVILWHDFRKSQVTDYLRHFGDIAKSKCISPGLIYSHQILPFVNPGWDENKYAVGRDLAVPQGMRLGVSLYGEASYGTSFFDWFKGTHRAAYGITEFHPLREMSAKELNSVLDQHFQNNARFLSFFIEASGVEEDPANKPNLFSFDLRNKNSGSEVLYNSIRDILKQKSTCNLAMLNCFRL